MDDHRDRSLGRRVDDLERAVRNWGITVIMLAIGCYLVLRQLIAQGILSGKDLVPDG
jgi:hypothetical protein